MKKRDDKIIKVLLLVLLLLVYPLDFLVQGITACSNISNSVSLTQSIYIQNGTCFTVNANNIYLNGSGFTVTGNTTGSFVLASDVVNITILNFNARNFSSFLNLTRVNSSLFTGGNYTADNFTSSLVDQFIELVSSYNDNISSNRIEINVSSVAVLSLRGASNNNSVVSNRIFNRASTSGAIELDSSYNGTILLNIIETNASSPGIQFLNTPTNNTISNNIINTTGSNAHGIDLAGSPNIFNNITNNIITTDSSGFGINIGGNGKGQSIFNNTILTRGSNAYGINLAGSNNSVSSNIINSSASGIYISGQNNTVFLNKINVSNSAYDGIGIISPYNVVHSNTINTTGTAGGHIIDSGHGVSLNVNAINNTIHSNNISTNFGDGILVFQGTNNTIYSNQIQTRGGTGIFIVDVNSTNVFYNIINITSRALTGSSLVPNGIYVNGYHTNVSNNYVETRADKSAAINITSPSSNNTFFNNSLFTNNTNSVGFILINVENQSISSSGIRTTGSNGYGIYLSATTFNITLQGNNINTSGGNASGIFIDRNSNGSVILYNTINTTGFGSSAFLINSSNTNISHNYFESRGDNSPPINITSVSLNNTFFNNTVFSNGTNSVGMNLVDVVNQSFVLNNVRTYGTNGYGIYLINNANNNSFVSNIVTSFGQAHSGYVVGSRNNTFTSNNFTSILGSSDALLIDGSNNTFLSFNTFNTSGVSSAGVTMSDTNGRVNGVTSYFNRIFTNNSNMNGPGIHVFGGSSKGVLNLNFTGENITTSGSNGTNVCANGASVLLNNISFTGLTANSKFLGFHTSSCNVDTSSNVTVSWFVNLSVVSKVNSSSLPGAGINITNSTGQSILFTAADSNGQASFTLTEYLANSTRNNYVSPYNFSINYSGYVTNFTSINLSLTNTTSFVVNLSGSANTSTDAGGTSGGGGSTSSSSGSGTTSVAPRSSDSSSESTTTTESTTETTTETAAESTTTSTSSTSVSVATSSVPVVAVSLFVNPVTGVPADNLAIVVGDFMPASEAIVLNDLVLSLQQSAVVKVPIQRESFGVETPLLSLQLNNTLGSIKSILGSGELPGVLATSSVDGLGADTKMDQFLNFNNSDGFDSNKVVFESNNENVPGDYFFARDGQPLFVYTTKFQRGLQSRTDSGNSVDAVLTDLKDKKITLLGEEFSIGNINVDTNGSRNNEVSVELLRGGVEGLLYQNESKTFSVNEKDYEVKVVILTSNNEAVLSVNGESLPKLVIGGTVFTISGVPVAIRDIIPGSGKNGNNIVRFYIGGKRVLLKDNILNDTGFTRSALKVNNKQILDSAVRINGFFLDGTSRVVINTIDYELDASSKEGNLYIPAGQTLKQNLKQPEAIFSDNLDMKYNGLKKQPMNPIKFTPEGNNKYYLEFKNQEGLKYKIPLATIESDGNIRYGERSAGNDRNLVFSEGNSNTDYTIQKNDYVIFSDIVNEGTLNTAPSFPVFNLGTMTDNFGFTKILQYNDYDPTNKVLKFTDLAEGIKDNTKYTTIDNNNNASLQIEGKIYQIKVNPSDGSLAADLNNDGFINNNFSIISVQGGGLIVLGTKNPKKNSENAQLQSINGTLNLTITTLAKKFSSGGTNFRAAFAFEPRTGGKIGIQKNQTLGINFVTTPTKEDPTSYALDGYGSYYTLINDSTGSSEILTIDYPENQRTIDFKIEGTPKKEEDEIKDIKPIPPDTTKIASQIDKLGQYNSVIIGSPCDNPMAAKLLNHPTPCDKDLPEDKALVKLFKFENNNIALLISARTPELTKQTTEKITKGEIKIDQSQATLITEQREIEPTQKQTQGTITEKTITE